jgi:hypothetical protein
MAAPAPPTPVDFWETWAAIAYALHRSERWCRYMAARANDPLPTWRYGGTIRLNVEDFQLWLLRQRGEINIAPPPRPAQRPVRDPAHGNGRRPPSCSVCGEVGHYRRTCRDRVRMSGEG